MNKQSRQQAVEGTLDVVFRPAQPADVRAVVPLLYASGPHEFDYVFRHGASTALDYLAFAFPAGCGTSSYRLATVATVGNRVVGVGVCHTRRQQAVIDGGNVVNILRFYGLRQGVPVVRRALRIGAVLPPPEHNTDYISQVGIHADVRGQGIGTALLRYLIARAQSSARRACTLDVAMTNDRAQHLYERLGFRVTAERAWSDTGAHGGVPGQRRMELALH